MACAVLFSLDDVAVHSAEVAVPVPSGLISWWKGDGTATDSMRENHGVVKDGAGYAPGLVGEAFYVNGLGYVEIPDSTSLSLVCERTPMTLELWVYPESSRTVQHILGIRPECLSAQFQMAQDPRGLHFNGANPVVEANRSLKLLEWQHLAVTFDSAHFSFYFNGELTGTASGILGDDQDGPLILGACGACGSNFIGLIDEISLYNRALSAEEIEAIYAAGGSGKVRETELQLLSQPQSQSILAGDYAVLRVSATGESPIAYQWYSGETGDISDPIEGANFAEFTTAASSTTTTYWVRVSNFAEQLDSQTARIVIGPGLSLTPVGEWPGYARGFAFDSCVVGSYAYLAAGVGGMHVIDVNDPTSPVRVGGADTLGLAVGIDVVGDCAYVAADEEGMVVFDVSDPLRPIQVGQCATEGWATTVTVVPPYAYVADAYAGLQLIDVSEPTQPVPVGGYNTSGWAANLWVEGAEVYVADAQGGVQVIDVSLPTRPVRAGEYDPEAIIWDVLVDGDYAYLAAGEEGMEVIDISDPWHPAHVGEYQTLGRVSEIGLLEPEGHLVIVGGPGVGLQVVDISSPESPTILGGIMTPGHGVNRVEVSGRYAYVADVDAGLQIFDLNDPTQPVQAGSWASDGSVEGLCFSGAFALLADGYEGLQVLDVSDPTAPEVVGHAPLGGYAMQVETLGSFAYVATGDNGLEGVYIEDDSQPVSVGKVSLKGAWDLTSDGERLYTLTEDGGTGIEIIEPREGGWHRTLMILEADSVIGSLCASHDRLYLAGSRLQVVDFTTPLVPATKGECELGGYARDSSVEGDHVYICGSGFLDVIDVSDPDSPRRVTSCELEIGARNVCLASGHVVVASAGGEVIAFDASEPAHLVRMGVQQVQGPVEELGVADDRVYVAGGALGFQVYTLTSDLRLYRPQRMGDLIRLSWERQPGVRLQTSSRLTNPDWQDVPGSELVSEMDFAMPAAPYFFRLAGSP